MITPNNHPLERLLHRLAGCILRHRGWFIYPQILLFGVSLMFAYPRLEFRADRDVLVSTEQGYHRQWLELKEEFRMQENLVTLVESDDLEKNRQFVERLAARLKAEPSLFENIFFKGDLRALGSKGLLFLPEQRLEEMLQALRDAEPLIQTFSEVTNLASLFSEVDGQMRAVPLEEAGRHPLTTAVPALTRIVQQGSGSVKRSGIPPSPGISALFAADGDPEPGEYIHFAGGRFYVITCTVPKEALTERAIVRLRELVRETQVEAPGVNVGVAGEPVLRYEERRQARADTTLASWVALTAVALTFIFCYHEVRRPLKATACLIVGIGYTLGFAALTVGHLNILTITVVPILLGLAIDFGVHLTTRFEEELRGERSASAAIEKALVVSGSGICTGGLAIAVAFLAMTLTGFKGLREMGLIAGGGLIVCLVPMMTMLPALLLRGNPEHARVAPSSGKAPRGRRARLEQIWLKRPWIVGGVGVALTLLAASQAYRVKFDYNLLNLQSQGLSAVVFERKLVETSSRSGLTCQVVAGSIDEALALERRILQLDTVAAVDSIAPLLAEDQQGKLDLVRQIREVSAAMRFAPMDTALLDLAVLDGALQSFAQAVGGGLHAAHLAKDTALEEQLLTLREALEDLRKAVTSDLAGWYVEKLTYYQQALFRDLSTTLKILQEQQYQEPLRAEDLPAGLRSRFIGRTGKFLLQVYPRGNVWERDPQEEFVRELRTVDPKVAGSPVRFYEHLGLLKGNFQKGAVYALLAVSLMLLLHFRNIICVLLALLPVLVGILWTLGWMVLLDIAFNPVNMIAFTLLIGIGVSNGVHILNRVTEEKHSSILSKSTGKAVLVSALTTAAGFGSLMLAQHAGIASLGQVMALGTTLCMLAALTILPAVLLLLNRSRWGLAHGWLSR